MINLSYSFFILSLFIVKSGSLIQANFFRNIDLARNSPCSDRRTSLAAAPETMQSEASSESVSVHLQLNSKSNSKDNETPLETVPDEEGVITIYEYVRKSSGSVVLAATSSPNALTDLEKFSVHVFGSNYTETEDMQLNKRTLDLKDGDQMKEYILLWKDGRLVSQQNNFPTFESKRQQLSPGPEVFKAQVNKIVMRFKQLLDGKERSDHVFSDFLRAQGAFKFQRNESLNRIETLALLKEFAVWFRSEFPYYYHQCSHCHQKEGGTFYGHVTPTVLEQSYLAGRTELYYCANEACAQTFRFPRYNDVTKVLDTRKGRCGEYSVLMMRMLQALGYDAKWVVDWADHVWCEVFVAADIEGGEGKEGAVGVEGRVGSEGGVGKEGTGSSGVSGGGDAVVDIDGTGAVDIINSLVDGIDGIDGISDIQTPLIPSVPHNIPPLPLMKKKQSEWIHIDPCEAAVNENYIYESWGKSQNYIVSLSSLDVLDVTEQYTTKFNETVIRRLESEISQDFVDAQLLAAKNEILNF